MPRIPYQPEDLAEPAAVVSAIRARRGGRLHELDRMLLHSPPFAQGWNAHLGAVRSGLSLDGRLRELAICAIAVLNQAQYEWVQHAPVFLEEGGSQAQLDALPGQLEVLRASTALPGPAPAQFSAVERALLQLTLEMTCDVKVADATFAAAREALGSERKLVEAVGTIATYNMVSRFLVALGVEEEG